jgi:hypothetical protein
MSSSSKGMLWTSCRWTLSWIVALRAIGERASIAARCELDVERTYDRCVGICYLQGEDIGEAMLRQGVARDCPRFSGGRYVEAEVQAAAHGATIGRAYALPGYCRPH